MSLPRYAEYGESGVDWIGSVPAHWTVAPIKRGFAVVGGSTPKSDEAAFWDGDIVWVSPADLSRLPSMYIGDSSRKITEAGLNSCGTTMVPAGSIVLSTRAPIGSLAISTSALCTNQGCKSLVPNDIASPNYFAYVLLSATTPLNLRGKGTTFLELSADELAAFKVPYPSIDEQAAIVAFLDRETAKIDALIAEQEKLIALLAEKRQATISHSVTKGLNPNAPMKDSGVAWLGEVPAHWSVKPLRYCLDYQEGPGILADDFRDEGIPLLRVAGVQSKWATLDGCNYLDPEKVSKRWQHFKLSKGDLLISASASMGTICEVGEEAEGAIPYTGIIRIRGRAGEMTKDFARHMVVSRPFLTQIDLLKAGATIQHYGPTHLSQMFAIQPPEVEQREIAAFIDQELTWLDRIDSQTERTIALLQERRSALVAAAVTGQIDVRNVPLR